jgi:carboxynorspermidine decarboxylase
MTIKQLPSPAFVCELDKLEENLKLLKKVQDEADVKILLALKGFALYHTFDICKEYLAGCSASGLNEALLANEKFQKELHTYSPAFKPDEFEEIVKISNHIVFNSLDELERYKNKLQNNSIGIRINPEHSLVDVELYNPCAIHSRLGVTKANFNPTQEQLSLIDGLHFHALCEQNVDALDEVLDKFEANFKEYFSHLKWLNFGGGHLITKMEYDVDGLIQLLLTFKSKYPHLQIYLEPSEAIGWQTGYLKATVLDIVNNGIDIAILDTSAEAHMPDTLAMPYTPEITLVEDDGYSYPISSKKISSITDDKYIIGTTHYGYDFTSAVQKDNIYGFQPHPEKSHDNGIQILKNFIAI